MRKSDWFFIIALMLLLVAGSLLFLYFYNDGLACVADPKKYHETLYNTTCYCFNEIKLN